MFRILPLLGCWQLKADDLPKDAEGASGKRAFSLPGATWQRYAKPACR